LVEWIIFNNLPLIIIQSDSFHQFINALDPAFTIPDVKLVKQLIHKAYSHTLPFIIEHIENNAIFINLTTDMWTARNRQGYLGITCNYLDEDFKLHERVLAIEYVRYPHTADHIGDTILSILDEWGIRDRTFVITTDNGANMKKAIQDLGLVSSNIQWQSCVAHTLQLIVGKGLAKVKLLVMRAKRLIDFFLRPKQSERLENAQKILNRQSDVVRLYILYNFYYFINYKY
jgi:zinc finger BED domain-containing protein 1 (E3 SUMO-protein ligase ZBED1)